MAVYSISMSIPVTTEICTVYTFSNNFRQILPFSVKLLYLKQTDLHGMCQLTEIVKRITIKLLAIYDLGNAG